jgi:multidrug efflux pump
LASAARCPSRPTWRRTIRWARRWTSWTAAAKLLKPGYTTDLNGTSREFRNSQGALGMVFVLALLFIFLVLAAQFESFVDPLVIMLGAAVDDRRAAGAQWSGGSLNVYSQIGLITLVGLITKHGILIVEFTNQLREQGMDMTGGVVKAAASACARS